MIRIQEHPELIEKAARWFHEKWGIPETAYLESMRACVERREPVPQWYVLMEGERVIAGLGVIERDFHQRPDLTPNVCAVYVEEAYRSQGIAGRMLDFVCREFREKGLKNLYLVTDHDTFYERYGWAFLCMVPEEDGTAMTRMYRYEL